MDYEKLLRMKEQLKEQRDGLPREALESFDKSFDIEYAHNSTAIEGNTLTLIQTKAIIEDGLSVGGKTLREIYEVANHDKAFAYVKKCVAESKPLDETAVKDIHALLMDNILVGGVIGTWKSVSPVRDTSRPHPARCTARSKASLRTCRTKPG